MQVDLKAPISKRTDFIPETHGFNFVNNFKVKPDFLGVDLGPWEMGFCGGMCAGALHRFKKGIGVPTNTVAPLDGTPLHEELMRRQIAAMSPEMLPVMYDWQSAPDVPTPMRKTSISKRTKNEWPKLQLMLDNMRPAILILIRSSGYFGNPTRNHQVLAVGYDFDPATRDLVVHTYDPNKPNRPQTLELNLGLPDGKLYLKDSASRTTRGFFVNPVGEKAIRMAVVNASG
jgi:hypothetical protein